MLVNVNALRATQVRSCCAYKWLISNRRTAAEQELCHYTIVITIRIIIVKLHYLQQLSNFRAPSSCGISRLQLFLHSQLENPHESCKKNEEEIRQSPLKCESDPLYTTMQFKYVTSSIPCPFPRIVGITCGLLWHTSQLAIQSESMVTKLSRQGPNESG